MTGKHTGLSEEEVLLAFAVEPIHNRKTLEHYLGEYPEHANALVDCSIELMVDATRGDEVALTSEAVVDQAWQIFQATVGQPAGGSIISLFTTLNPTDFKSLARKLDINNLLLVRLRDRAINAATIPQRLIQALATELGATVETVMAYLRNPPAMVSGHSFKSDMKPAVTEQISFEKAVETSQLTPDQQEALKALAD